MSRQQALTFLILQTLNKNKTKIPNDLHIEIAKSLKIIQKKERSYITWLSHGKNNEIVINDKKFSFYIKSEFDQASDDNQIDINENNARELVLEIIKLSS